MTRVVLCAIAIALAGKAFCAVDEAKIQQARALRDAGAFSTATQALQTYLQEPKLTPEQRRAAEFEIEKIRRTRQDYTLTGEAVFAKIRERVPDFTQKEFDALERQGKFDCLTIDGQKRFVSSSARNIFMMVPELNARQTNRKSDGTLRKLYDHMQEVKQAQQASGDGLLCPQDFKVSYKLSVKADAVPEGKKVRCWLPYVSEFSFQTSPTLLQSDPVQYQAAPDDAPHRTIYLEKVAEKGKPTVFSEDFVYRCFARAYKLDPAKVKPYRKNDADYRHYTAEHKPHIDFCDEYLRKLNAQIVGDETNPLLVAKRIYDWIGHNMIYQYAREYSTIDNIAHYCASRKAGDCGQHGMVFIALCRMNGIPARWQTGWESFEASGNNMHDWSEIYVEPYGWIPVDADMAVVALHSDSLAEAEKKELAEWLFGNQDHFRFAVNSDFGAALVPPKNDFRSETVDFQRGEVECEDKNLYFDQWSWNMSIDPISPEEMAGYAARK